VTLAAPTYDLVMLLDPQAEADDRARIVADARSAIEARGELLRHDDWGERPLTYPIERKASAEYHLLQFHVGDKELLSGLDHTLRITDGLLRFRIIKLKPGVPDAPDMRSNASAVRRPDEGAPEAAEAPAAETPAEAAPAAEQAIAEPAAPAASDEIAAEQPAAPTPETSPEAPAEAAEAPAADAGAPDPA
jgi:small subunit ribosomal protein S6